MVATVIKQILTNCSTMAMFGYNMHMHTQDVCGVYGNTFCKVSLPSKRMYMYQCIHSQSSKTIFNNCLAKIFACWVIFHFSVLNYKHNVIHSQCKQDEYGSDAWVGNEMLVHFVYGTSECPDNPKL